jgi:signal transduction histidine kinase
MKLEEPPLPYAGFTWTEVGIIGGICVLLAAISFLTNLNSACCAPSTQAELFRSVASTLANSLLWALAALPIFWACVRLYPRTQGGGMRGWGVVIGGHLLLAAVSTYAVGVGQHLTRAGILTFWPPSDPPDELFHPVETPVEVLTTLEFLGGLVPYVILLMIGLGRYEYLRSQARQQQAERIEREAEQLRSKLTTARLESLRMQINPHFFHNTLHTISTMAGRDPEGIRRATARLSDLMRHVLSTSDQQEGPLEEEMDVLESYLDIQKLRLGDRLTVTFDIDAEVRPALVPTLLLQPLAENAVKHGFEGADETGHLVIRATREGEQLVLAVADDGPGLNDAAPGENEIPSDPMDGTEGVGLQNISERLDGLYGDAASLDFEPSADGGLRVVVRLPYHTASAERTLRASGIVAE